MTIDGPEREGRPPPGGASTTLDDIQLCFYLRTAVHTTTPWKSSTISLAYLIDSLLIIMESYHLSQFPVDHSSVHLAFFKNVTNSADLRKRLVAAATMEGEEGDKERDLLDYAFVEANMVSPSDYGPET